MSFPNTVWGDDGDEQVISVNQHLPLGTRMVFQDGRVYRYAQAAAVALADHIIVRNGPEMNYSSSTAIVFTSTYAAGTTYVQIGGQASNFTDGTDSFGTAKDDYKDGWLVINSTDTAYNQMVKIVSHAALVSSSAVATSANYLNLKRPGLLKNVETETALIKLVASPYKRVRVIVGDPAAIGFPEVPVGVTPRGVTASYYFWLQTWGPALVLGDIGYATSNDKAGVKAVVASGGTGAFCFIKISGGVSGTDSGMSIEVPEIGWIMAASPADTFFTMVNLTLAP